MSDLRQSFAFTWLDGTTPTLIPESTGTNNVDGSNADDTNWNTSYASPWNTVVGRWTWTHGGTTHRVIYDRDLGWSSTDIADGSGWTQSTQSNGYIRWTRTSDSLYYELDPSDPWVSGSPPAPTSGGGTGTESVPVVQWSASFSKDPGTNYWRWTVTGLNTDATDYIYLYDYMPTTTSTEPAIMTRTFAASSTSSTQYGLFTPDETKTYYVINYHGGSSSTNTGAVVLASKNFANKKVFCNFW